MAAKATNGRTGTNGTHAASSATVPAGNRRPSSDCYSHPAISNHDARRIAVEAMCDPRTVYKYLHGHAQRTMQRERLERAMRACGFAHLVGYATQTAAVRALNARAAADQNGGGSSS